MRDESGVYGLIVEFKQQGPILLEGEAEHTSFDAVMKRKHEMAQRPDVIRVCVVTIQPMTTWEGNTLLFQDMKRMQK